MVPLSRAMRQRRRNGAAAFLRACASKRAALRRVRGDVLDLHASASGCQAWSGCPAATRLRAEASMTEARSSPATFSRRKRSASAASSKWPHASNSAARNQQPQPPRADTRRAAKSSAASAWLDAMAPARCSKRVKSAAAHGVSRELANCHNSEIVAAE